MDSVLSPDAGDFRTNFTNFHDECGLGLILVLLAVHASNYGHLLDEFHIFLMKVDSDPELSG